jgi:hypothetical protein
MPLDNIFRRTDQDSSTIQNESILSEDIKDGTLVAADLADNAVTTPKITNGAVTDTKISDTGVTTAKIVDGAVTAAKIPVGVLTGGHMVANTITVDKFQTVPANIIMGRDNAAAGNLEAIAVADTEIVIGNGAGFTTAALSSDVTMDNAGAVTIANSAVTTAKIADDAITNDKMSLNHIKVDARTLSAANVGEYAFIWQNPESAKIMVHRCIIDITTAAGAAAVLDVGAADDQYQSGDTLIDNLGINAVGAHDNLHDPGVNGEPIVKLDESGGTTDWITGLVKTQNAASLAGKYYIFYTAV